MISNDTIDEQFRIVKGYKYNALPWRRGHACLALQRTVAAFDFHVVTGGDLELPGILCTDFDLGSTARLRQLLNAPGHRCGVPLFQHPTSRRVERKFF